MYGPGMRIFLAGATGVIGSRLTPRLVAAGHEVAGMTRSEERAKDMDGSVTPVVVDVFDRERLIQEVERFSPDLVMHHLTDLPDDPSRVAEFDGANARIRREGTDNLLAAARRAGSTRVLAQSVAWRLEGATATAVEHLESSVLEFGGTVLRYGRLYGPDTYHEDEPPPPPRIHVDEAAEITSRLLEAKRGVVEILEADEPR